MYGEMLAMNLQDLEIIVGSQFLVIWIDLIPTTLGVAIGAMVTIVMAVIAEVHMGGEIPVNTGQKNWAHQQKILLIGEIVNHENIYSK